MMEIDEVVDFESTEVIDLPSSLGDILFQGAEARVYDGIYLGKTSVIKERFSKKYRHPELDRRINIERTKAEIRCLCRANQTGIPVPAIYFIDKDKNRIVMEKIENSVTLREFISNIENKDFLNDVVTKMGNVIGKFHSNQIVHGDLTTSNFLVQKEAQGNYRVIPIDFGLATVDTGKNLEPKAVDLYVMERALLSTHPNSQPLFELIMQGYKNSFKQANKIIIKLDDIRARGRKRDMVG